MEPIRPLKMQTQISGIDKEAMVVYAGAYIDVDGTLTEDDKRAVVYSLLYAQLATARRLNDPSASADQWYALYRGFLETCYWVIPPTSFTTLKSLTGSSVDSLVVSKAIQDSNALDQLKKLIKALGNTSNNGASNLFYTSSYGNGVYTKKASTFQLVTVSKDTDNNELVINLGAYNVITTDTLSAPLFYKYTSNDNQTFSYNTAKAILDLDLWAKVKDTILSKISDEFKDDLIALKL